MLLRGLRCTAIAAAAAISSFMPTQTAAQDNTPSGQSTFILPDKSFAFGFTVPDHDNTDVFFSLRVSTKYSWGGVGLGSDDMPGALFLIIYQNNHGTNVTFSSRLAYGHYEPKYYDEIQIEAMNGTGVQDGFMMLTAKCSNCRSWPSAGTSRGYLDVSSPNQKTIFALGQDSSHYRSDSPSAPLDYHQIFGSFTIDMGRTRGSADAPYLDDNSESEGTTLEGEKTDEQDGLQSGHATLMVLCVMGVLPLGAILQKMGAALSYHAITQTIGLVGVIVGLVLGILTSARYQRSKGFKSAHQVLGFIILVFLLGQFSLGLLHHRKYIRTQQGTMFGVIHRWFGRGLFVLAFVNAILGVNLAGDRRFGYIVPFVLVPLAYAVFVVLRAYRPRRTAKPPGIQHLGLDPGRQSPGLPPAYEPTSADIPLQPVPPSSPWRRSADEGKDDEHDPNLGHAQAPRDMV